MKYSQTIGIIASLLIVTTGFFNWVFVPGLNRYFTGLDMKAIMMGSPIYINYFLATIIIILFALPKIWAKKLNMFVAGIGGAWNLRNFILLGSCADGDCLMRQPALWLYFILGLFVFLMALLPKMQVDRDAL